MSQNYSVADIPCSHPSIQYWGKWSQDNHYQTTTQYSICVFSFLGSYVSCALMAGPDQGMADLYLDDVFQGTVDCYCEIKKIHTYFHKEGLETDRPHFLRITASKKHNPASAGTSLEIVSFQAETPYDYPAQLREQMEQEYALIESLQKPVSDVASWHPVAYQAEVSKKGVRLLDSLVQDIYRQNVDLVKYDFTLPAYCEGESTDDGGPGWSGWLPGSNHGRMLAGAALALLWGEDPELRKIVDTLVAEVKNTMREDGYMDYYPEKLNYPLRVFKGKDVLPTEENIQRFRHSERKNYDRVFLTRGLIAAAEAGNPDALPLVRRMYNWLYQHDDYMKYLLRGSNATNGLPGGPLVYHTKVGIPEDIFLNERFYNQEYWFNAFRNEESMCLGFYPGECPHCYQLLQLEALADLYRATGDQAYLTALHGAWNIYTKYYKHLGGTAAICEDGWLYYPQSYHVNTGRTGEACGNVFWIWDNDRLMQLFPDEEKYAAEIEESIFNALIAARTEKNGFTRCFNHLHGKKDTPINRSCCCEVSTTMVISGLPQYIYTAAPANVYVNLFIPSEYDGTDLKLRQETNFPYDGKVTLTVLADSENECTLHLRVPSWADSSADILVNGVLEGQGTPGTFVSITRHWSKGDTIQADFPMSFHLVKYIGINQVEHNLDRYGLTYGPILMALTGDFEENDIPRLTVAPEDILSKLIPGDAPLTFTIKGQPGFTVKPYYAIRDEIFTCYPVVAPQK